MIQTLFDPFKILVKNRHDGVFFFFSVTLTDSLMAKNSEVFIPNTPREANSKTPLSQMWE